MSRLPSVGWDPRKEKHGRRKQNMGIEFMFVLAGRGRLNHLRLDEMSLKLDVGKRLQKRLEIKFSNVYGAIRKCPDNAKPTGLTLRGVPTLTVSVHTLRGV